MRIVNTGKGIMLLEVDTGEAALITQALKNYNEHGEALAQKMLNEQEVIINAKLSE